MDVSIVAEDVGGDRSDAQIAVLSLQAQIDPVTATVTPEGTIFVNEGESVTMRDIGRVVTFSDADFLGVNSTLSVTSGTLSIVGSTGGATVSEEGANLRVEGSSDEANVALLSLTYTPAHRFFGSDILSIEGANAMIIIEVAPVNAAPTLTVAVASVTIDEDELLSFSTLADGSPLIALSDDEFGTGAAGTYSLMLTVHQGVLFAPAAVGVSVEGNNSVSILLQDTSLTDLQDAVTGLVYRPDEDYFGTDSVDVLFSDGSTVPVGSLLSVQISGAIAITINSVDDPPEFLVAALPVFDAIGNGAIVFGRVLTLIDVDAASTDLVVVELGIADTEIVFDGDVDGNGVVDVDIVSGPVSTLTGSVDDINAVLVAAQLNLPDGAFGTFVTVTGNLPALGEEGEEVVIVFVANVLVSVGAAAEIVGYEDEVLMFAECSNCIAVASASVAVARPLTVTLTADSGDFSYDFDLGVTSAAPSIGAPGSLTVSGTVGTWDSVLAGITYTPDSDVFGQVGLAIVAVLDTVSYMPVGESSIRIIGVNDAPVISISGSSAVPLAEDSSFTASSLVLVDTDSLDTESVTVTFAVDDGSVSLDAPDDVAVSMMNGVVVVRGSLQNVQDAVVPFTYMPAPDVSGSRTLVVSLVDAFGASDVTSYSFFIVETPDDIVLTTTIDFIFDYGRGVVLLWRRCYRCYGS